MFVALLFIFLFILGLDKFQRKNPPQLHSTLRPETLSRAFLGGQQMPLNMKQQHETEQIENHQNQIIL